MPENNQDSSKNKSNPLNKIDYSIVITWAVIIIIGIGLYGLFDKNAYNPISSVMVIILVIIMGLWSWLTSWSMLTWCVISGIFVLGWIEHSINTIHRNADIILRKLDDIENKIDELSGYGGRE